ncbi:MAG: hypothetical protein JNM55_01380 [Anaerolineales bacterium]|nr:hypothetical protein [Anaerolineales bacterium]
MKSKIIKPILLGLVLLSFFLLFSVNYYYQREKKTQAALKNDIYQQVLSYRSKESSVIDLSIINSFSWDTLFVYGPYMTADMIQKGLGLSWMPSLFSKAEAATPSTLLIFTKMGKVVQYVYYPLVMGHFGDVGESVQGIDRDNAKFVINEHDYIIWLYK